MACVNPVTSVQEKPPPAPEIVIEPGAFVIVIPPVATSVLNTGATPVEPINT